MRHFDATIDTVCTDMDVPRDRMIMLPGRRAMDERTLAARGVAVVVLHDEIGHSYPSIAEAFGRSTHSTVCNWRAGALSGRFAREYPDDMTADEYARSVAGRVVQ